MMSRTGAGGFAERPWTIGTSLRTVTGVAGVAPKHSMNILEAERG
jgi:hypothetical protein